jgi:hypothetical protein
VLLERLNGWSAEELPRLNHAVIFGGADPTSVAAELHRSVLPELPEPDSFSPTAAMQAVVDLGLIGASVARHFQQADPSRKEVPEQAFRGLSVGAGQTPFPEYFTRLAARTGTGHYLRDSYASLVRWNVPTIEVHWNSEQLARLPGCFDDNEVRTYTGDVGERLFFELIKKSEALERAANDLLQPLSDGTVGMESADGLERVRTATVLLMALRQLNLDFTSRPSHESLTPEHFLDVFRQFAVHWHRDDIPPSGAQDPEFLKRDFLLGIDFPGYDHHVRRMFPALLDEERSELTRAMARPSLPTMLVDSLGMSFATLAQTPLAQLREIIRTHPALAAYYLLLNANARVAGVHLMLTKRFLFKPQRDREQAGLPDSPLVSNRRGTTGMDELLLERLSLARKNHPLGFLHHLHSHHLAEVGGLEPIPAIHTEDVAEMIRYGSTALTAP